MPAVAAAERYAALFARGGCPPLFLAPMEGLGDRPFRRALAATVGGFDEACTEFIRIPGCMPDTHAQLLKAAAKLTSGAYDALELGHLPLAAQLMGSVPEFLGAAAQHLAGTLGAHRIDLNCGCPGAPWSCLVSRVCVLTAMRRPQPILLPDAVRAHRCCASLLTCTSASGQ
jgi:tRNA-dihydrouridine synthase C